MGGIMVLLLLIISLHVNLGHGDANMTMWCTEKEREALLAFKQGLNMDEISQAIFSSWGSEVAKQDCCRWEGVSCDNQTGHVVRLDLGHHHSLQGTTYMDDTTFIWKGSMHSYRNILGLVKRIDLSSNRLTGEIPSEITDLVGLVSLNLSRNRLTGEIPTKIGELQSLDALDLSRNLMDGKIPTSLARIDRLSCLDLSYNNFNDRIPTGTQLQSFDPSVYAGNPQLCGPPLQKMCGNQTPIPSNEEEKDDLITWGFYVSMELGFIVGFGGACGSLIFIRPWRYSYFKFLNVLNDCLYVRVISIKQHFN